MDQKQIDEENKDEELLFRIRQKIENIRDMVEDMKKNLDTK